MLKNNKKSLKFIAIIIAILAITTILVEKQKNSLKVTGEKTVIESTIVEEKKVSNINIDAEIDNQNALELLQSVAEVEYQEYEFGVFVESINGIKGDDKHFWALYVNEEQSQTGAKQTILKKGDKVEWRYEEIKY